MVETPPKRVLVFGASGTIGQACVEELLRAGHEVVSFVRPRTGPKTGPKTDTHKRLAGSEVRYGDVTNAASIQNDAFCGETFDVVLSCLASRTGDHDEAWLIDYEANAHILRTAQTANVAHMILLSAICVQKPRLAFQHAKLAFEKELAGSGLIYSIVRPTAFFKSLSGQIDRVSSGKPFLLLGDGELTSCKPISDQDLAWFITDCIVDQTKQNTILPIGGPGPAITPKQQADLLFELTGQNKKYRTVPLWVFDSIIGMLGVAGTVSRKAKAKADYARIGRYYATESMLLLNQKTGQYSADATPETGSRTLADHYRDLIMNGPEAR